MPAGFSLPPSGYLSLCQAAIVVRWYGVSLVFHLLDHPVQLLAVQFSFPD